MLALKVVHILGVVLFLGAGLGTAFTKVWADRSGNIVVIAWAHEYICVADRVFTFPSAFIVPISGIALAQAYSMPLTTPWVLAGIVGFVVTGLLWLPAYRLQLRMRDLSRQALAAGEPLPAEFHHATRIWLALGFPAFALALATMWVMVAKPTF